MNYYGYIRVSTETQADKGYGIDAQRDEINKYAARNEIEITAIYQDAGISGNIKDDEDDDAINKRAGLMEMLSVISEGDAIVVLNTNRLWRSDMTKAIIRRELIRRKAQIIDIEHPNYDLYKVSKDPSAYLTNAIMEALDVYDRMSINLKLARGRTMKARGGDKPAGTVPFGYKYSEDKKSIEVNPDEEMIVKKMFSLGQTGDSLSKIADQINKSGARTRHGKEFSKGTIAAILNNRFYIGELQHAGQTIKGNHKAIISRVQFGKVQSQLEKRKRG